jgi:hypothetical protein
MPATVELELVRPRDLDLVWEAVARTLSWGSAHRIALPALRNLARIGYICLWIAPDWRFPTRLSSVIVTTIIERPRKAKTLRIEFLSGRHIGTWIDSAACTLSQHAQAHGCTHLEFIGRTGWQEYRSRFNLPGTWLTEARAADRCQLLRPTRPKIQSS